ncbi:hypothetical protein IW967_11635 [Alicyclobacillus mali]|uniref:Uncharacterized protein n=1 Tax=Alicyclobacillus mali (ex Roth et al. 2021) TaxID=1123961 RepID=A0ABS0F5C2_9BACL|nr:hypothetical protein [Alicyclobacillus mali (ex Roth et al. 2021)]MBF8378506.1 hypothetical protein [Alicyclobacillus mali (ex Roth et al. 2021)]
MQYEAAVIAALCDADQNRPERAQVTLADLEALAAECTDEYSPCCMCRREFPQYEMELAAIDEDGYAVDWVCEDCMRRLAPLYEE